MNTEKKLNHSHIIKIISIIKILNAPRSFRPITRFRSIARYEKCSIHVIKCFIHLFRIRDKISPLRLVNPPLFIITPWKCWEVNFCPPPKRKDFAPALTSFRIHYIFSLPFSSSLYVTILPMTILYQFHNVHTFQSYSFSNRSSNSASLRSYFADPIKYSSGSIMGLTSISP